jgi:hypothetical protein
LAKAIVPDHGVSRYVLPMPLLTPLELSHRVSPIKMNLDYACRLPLQKGLGLVDIDGTVPGLILIGRRKDVSESTNHLRHQLCHDLKIEIHTYDMLLDWAKSRVVWCEEQRE